MVKSADPVLNFSALALKGKIRRISSAVRYDAGSNGKA